MTIRAPWGNLAMTQMVPSVDTSVPSLDYKSVCRALLLMALSNTHTHTSTHTDTHKHRLSDRVAPPTHVETMGCTWT